MKCWVVGVVLGAIVACTAKVPALPSQGGPAWIEVASPHFTLWTDAPPARGHQLVREFERRRQIVARAMNHAPARERVFVIAPRTAWEASAYLPEQFVGMALSGNASLRSAIVISADDNGRDHVVSHELTHAISIGVVHHQPAWLSEGIATYFEMADLDSDARTVTVGVPREDRLRLVRARELLPLRELFACEAMACRDERFYATAWALFSFLLNNHFEAFAQYLTRLDADVDEAEAWAATFADPLAAFDVALGRWVINGDLRLPKIEIEVAPVEATVRVLGDGDVLASRSLMTYSVKRDAAAARALATSAVAADRTSVLAWLVTARIDETVPAEAARAVAAAHPDDWRAWWLVGRFGDRDDEREAAGAQACKLAPEETWMCRAR